MGRVFHWPIHWETSGVRTDTHIAPLDGGAVPKRQVALLRGLLRSRRGCTESTNAGKRSVGSAPSTREESVGRARHPWMPKRGTTTTRQPALSRWWTPSPSYRGRRWPTGFTRSGKGGPSAQICHARRRSYTDSSRVAKDLDRRGPPSQGYAHLRHPDGATHIPTDSPRHSPPSRLTGPAYLAFARRIPRGKMWPMFGEAASRSSARRSSNSRQRTTRHGGPREGGEPIRQPYPPRKAPAGADVLRHLSIWAMSHWGWWKLYAPRGSPRHPASPVSRPRNLLENGGIGRSTINGALDLLAARISRWRPPGAVLGRGRKGATEEAAAAAAALGSLAGRQTEVPLDGTLAVILP